MMVGLNCGIVFFYAVYKTFASMDEISYEMMSVEM